MSGMEEVNGDQLFTVSHNTKTRDHPIKLQDGIFKKGMLLPIKPS